MCEICLRLTINTPEQYVNEVALMSLTLNTYFTHCSGVSIATLNKSMLAGKCVVHLVCFARDTILSKLTNNSVSS